MQIRDDEWDARLVGRLVLLRFLDHAKGTEDPLPCMIVGWVSKVEALHVAVTPWLTDDEPDRDEAFAILRSTIKEAKTLCEP